MSFRYERAKVSLWVLMLPKPTAANGGTTGVSTWFRDAAVVHVEKRPVRGRAAGLSCWPVREKLLAPEDARVRPGVEEVVLSSCRKILNQAVRHALPE
jgi:hypothetical protein